MVDMSQIGVLNTILQPNSVSESEKHSVKSGLGFRTDINFRSSYMQRTGLDPTEMIRRIERAEKVAFMSPLKYHHRAIIP